MPREIDDILREAGGREWGSLEELNAWTARQMQGYNSRPQAELFGLSPDRAARLFAGDWEAEGPLRLNEDLTLNELSDARLLHDVRALIALLSETGPVKATAASKNLPRKFIGELIERVIWEEDELEEIRYVTKVIDEMDVFRLHVVRVLSDVAGLIKLRAGKFSATRKGKDLLSDDMAGKLYVHLFRTCFRVFNLEYFTFYGSDNPALQQTIAMTLYRLRSEARSWSRCEELVVRVLMEAALRDTRDADEATLQLEMRILKPLTGFGLLEKRRLPGEHRYLRQYEYRKSRLYDRFIRFEF